MPSDRYFKLNEDKQQRIMGASMDEFIKSGIHDASINKIIKDADISRGSFYTYFTDKTELFGYIFRMLKTSAARMIINEVIKQKGDIFKAARKLVLRGTGNPEKAQDKTAVLFDRIMSDFGIIAHLNEVNVGDSGDIFEGLLHEIYIHMNDLKEHLSEKEFHIIADMMVVMSVKALVTIKKNPEFKDKILNVLYKQYDVMEKGIRGGALK